MAWKGNTSEMFGNEGEEGKALWDLRVVRAKFISMHFLAIDDSSRKKDYPEWIRNVKLLYRFVDHHLYKKDKKVREKYKKRLNDVVKIVNKYPGTYFGKNFDAVAVTELEDAIFELEMFISLKMEDAGLWGTSFEEYDGL